jgi:hypothetical protein
MNFLANASGRPSGAARENMSGSVYVIFRNRSRLELILLSDFTQTEGDEFVICDNNKNMNKHNGFITYKRPLKQVMYIAIKQSFIAIQFLSGLFYEAVSKPDFLALGHSK